MILFLLPFALGALAALGLGFGREVPAPKPKRAVVKKQPPDGGRP